MRWPGAPAASSEPSTPGSPASARSTPRRASRPGGGRRSSRRWSPRIAATSTAWGWWTAARGTVTALGETDAPAGWREGKAKGGIVMDVASGEVIARGLSMPHSPRWYAGRLWVCESGAGSFWYLDPKTGRYEAIAEVPGFTRGVDFAGPIAFVRLSQVRESAVFSGFPLIDRLEERDCGVYAVHLETGRVIAFLQFTSGVQEIFAVRGWPAAVSRSCSTRRSTC